MSRYRSPTVCYDGEVSLDEFSDEDIREEYAHRFDGIASVPILTEEMPMTVSGLRLREIHALLRMGRTSAALRAAEDLIRDTFGTAI